MFGSGKLTYQKIVEKTALNMANKISKQETIQQEIIRLLKQRIIVLVDDFIQQTKIGIDTSAGLGIAGSFSPTLSRNNDLSLSLEGSNMSELKKKIKELTLQDVISFGQTKQIMVKYACYVFDHNQMKSVKLPTIDTLYQYLKKEFHEVPETFTIAKTDTTDHGNYGVRFSITWKV